MGAIKSGLAFVGRIKAIFGLVGGSIIAVLCFVVGLALMIRNKQIGIGLLVILLGAIILAVSILVFYWVTRSETGAAIYGAYAIADDIFDAF